MAGTFRCKLCGFRGPSALVNRHILLTHKAAEQPVCKVCGDVAEVWATRSHKTAYCNQHRTRYGLCRWCNHPRETGWGSGTAACLCGRMGYLREGAIDSPAGSSWHGCHLMACGRRLNVWDGDPLALKLRRGWDVELCPVCAKRATGQGMALPGVPVKRSAGEEGR